MGRLVEKTAAHLIADQPERSSPRVRSPTSSALPSLRVDQDTAGQNQEQQVRHSEKQKPDPTVARLEVLSAQAGELPHGPIPLVDNEKARRQMLVVSVQDPDSRTPLQELPAVEEPAEDPLGHRPGGKQEAPRPSQEQRSHQNSRTLRGRAIQQGHLDFLAIIDVGTTAGPPVAEAEE